MTPSLTFSEIHNAGGGIAAIPSNGRFLRSATGPMRLAKPV